MSFFEIGIYRPRTKENVGTLWRSAYSLGASGIFTIGVPYMMQASDATKASRHIPLRYYHGWESFVESLPDNVALVGVEIGGILLKSFSHPKQAVYVLGSENVGIPAHILGKCNAVVSVEAVGQSSYNVAVAGSIVMYHRLTTCRNA